MAFQSSSNLAGNPGPNAAVPVPAGAAIGDIAVVGLYMESTATVTPPAGFTQKADLATSPTAQGRLVVFWKRLTAADSGTWTFTFASTFNAAAAGLWSGRIATGDPFDGAPGTAQSVSGVLTLNVSTSPAAANGDAVGFWTNFNGGGAFTAPTNYTQRQSVSGVIALETRDAVVSGSTGNVTATNSITDFMKAFLGVLADTTGGAVASDTRRRRRPGMRARSLPEMARLYRRRRATDTVTDSGVVGTVAVAQAADTATATGQLGYSGTVARTQANNTSAASGTVAGSGISGNAAVTEASDTSSASGQLGYTGAAAPSQAGDTITSADTFNYLINPDFETDTNSDGLSDSWLSEWSIASPPPTYTRTATGSVQGTRAQRMQWTGTANATGSNKVEFYQATSIGSFAAGDPATFEVWLSGSVTGGGYAQIVIEGHTGSTYLDEVQQIVALTVNPQPFRLTHPSLPVGTDSIVVVVMALELTSTSVVDITADYARVEKTAEPAIVRRMNLCANPTFDADSGTSVPALWSTANTAPVTVAYSYPTTSVPYGSKKLNLTLGAVTSGTANQVQLISPTSANGTVAPGDSVTVSVNVAGSLTGCTFILRLQFLTAAGASAGTSDSGTLTVTSTATRLAWTAVAPATTAAVRALIRVTAIAPGDAFSLDLDGVLLENAASAGSYFDGSIAGFEWTGTPNASASRELIQVPNAIGSASAVQASNVSAASGIFTGGGISGSAAVTQAANTASASGIVTAGGAIAGSAAVTQANQAASAVGKLGYSGTAAATQVGQTASASGKLGYTGTSSATQAANVVTASGAVTSPVAGSAAAIQANQTASASGVLRYTGTVAGSQGSNTAVIQGVVFIPITGTVAAAQADQSASASGTALGDIVIRPNTGTTSRPGSGVTPRPFAGVTDRP